jgi:hypothetical protein
VKASICTTVLTLIGSLLLAVVPVQLHASDSDKSLYKQGQAAETSQNYDAAYNSYRKAMQDEPSDLKYKVSCERVRPLAAAQHVK